MGTTTVYDDLKKSSLTDQGIVTKEEGGQIMSRTRAATFGLLVPAGLALAMSADTSFRFLEQTLGITDHTERLVLCGVAEAAIVALTIYAWATHSRGIAYLTYTVVLVQAIPAFEVSGATGGPVRVALGPVLLAVLLHLLLGLELRMSGRKSDGLLARAGRELRERLTAFLGIGRRGEDSAAIARSRAADRAVDLSDKLVAATTAWGRARVRARLADAIDAARHGLEPEEAERAEAAIVARVVRRKSVDHLAEIKSRHDWTVSLARDTGTRDASPVVSAPVSPVPALVPGGTTGQAVSPTPVPIGAGQPGQSVSPSPAPVSRPKAAVPASASPSRSAVHVSLVKAGQPKVVVPAEHTDSLSAAVRWLRLSHTEDEIRDMVPTLPGFEKTKPDTLKKAIQRTRPKK